MTIDVERSAIARRLPIFGLLTANAISLIGDALAVVAIPWFVYDTTGSAVGMGIVGFFTVLPRVLATFFGGALVDRLGFKPSSMLADTLSAVSVALIPLLHHWVGLSFPLLVALVFLGALFDGPGATARECLVPALARTARLPLDRVNGIMQVVPRFSFFIGPALAGVLIGRLGTSNVLWVDALTFVVSAVLIGLTVPQIEVARERLDAPHYWRDLKDNLAFIRHDHLLLWIVVVVGVLNFFEAPLGSVLLPVLARTRFGDATALGVLLSLLGAGAVISAAVYASAGVTWSRYRAFVGSFLVLGAPYWLLMLMPAFPLAALSTLVLGLAAGPINPIIMSIRQERVPPAIRGTVFGMFSALAWVTLPVGQLAGGVAVEMLGIQMTFFIIALCFLGVTTSMLFIPALREMGRLTPVSERDSQVVGDSIASS